MEFMDIAELFGCSISTVNKIKNVILQYCSSNIIENEKLVLELFSKK